MNLPVIPLQDILAVLPVLLTILAPIAASAYQHSLTRLPQNQRETINQVVGTVVGGIEQQFQSGQIQAHERKDAAMNLATVICNQLGVSKFVSPELLSMMIEAAVNDMNAGKSPLHMPEPASVGFHPADAVTPPGDFYARAK